MLVTNRVRLECGIASLVYSLWMDWRWMATIDHRNITHVNIWGNNGSVVVQICSIYSWANHAPGLPAHIIPLMVCLLRSDIMRNNCYKLKFTGTDVWLTYTGVVYICLYLQVTGPAMLGDACNKWCLAPCNTRVLIPCNFDSMLIVVLSGIQEIRTNFVFFLLHNIQYCCPTNGSAKIRSFKFDIAFYVELPFNKYQELCYY